VGFSSELEEREVDCSGRIVLGCRCGERLTLLGLEEDWRLEERIDFECKCGERLTLSNRLDEEALTIMRLLRGGMATPSGGNGRGAHGL
jgi:hypothetical protein